MLQLTSSSDLSFSGLEKRRHQRQALRDATDVNLPNLEYGTLAYLAPGPVWSSYKNRIFKFWHMDSDSCHSSVAHVKRWL